VLKDRSERRFQTPLILEWNGNDRKAQHCCNLRKSLRSRRSTLAGRILSAVPVLLLLLDSVMKFPKPAPLVEAFARLGHPERRALGSGVVRLGCVVLYGIPRTTVLDASGLSGCRGEGRCARSSLAEVRLHVWVEHRRPESKMSGLDRRMFLKTAAASAAAVSPTAVALQLPKAEPRQPSKSGDTGGRERTLSSGRLSRTRLGRMHEVMSGYIDRGEVPGMVTLVSRGDEVHVDAMGMKAQGGKDPVRRDTIFASRR